MGIRKSAQILFFFPLARISQHSFSSTRWTTPAFLFPVCGSVPLTNPGSALFPACGGVPSESSPRLSPILLFPRLWGVPWEFSTIQYLFGSFPRLRECVSNIRFFLRVFLFFPLAGCFLNNADRGSHLGSFPRLRGCASSGRPITPLYTSFPRFGVSLE